MKKILVLLASALLLCGCNQNTGQGGTGSPSDQTSGGAHATNQANPPEPR